ncbi:putative short transient receptor potential channel 4-associated protein isoform X2 [Apostichopus japonicus]|uniref:Putative short transient receptor potential channel 4-associated protein isoform X2 n=1 Tax=Stichopus japonicus TaxID=307972 RepID=A0A2G8KPZ1_STIJA|nr:putative short transient receptor potential channel 4-associated protein isoform X2 [Apostichopus japonicus]WDP79893.1 transient receptor potential cation channel subfamily C member 4-2 [Apostichopus japonicus]
MESGTTKKRVETSRTKVCSHKSMRIATTVVKGKCRTSRNIFHMVNNRQMGKKPVLDICKLPVEVLEDSEKRIGLEKKYWYSYSCEGHAGSSCQAHITKDSNSRIFKNNFEMHEDNDRKGPVGRKCGTFTSSKPGEEPKDSKSVYSEVHDLFGGVEVTVGILLQPFYFPPKDSSNRPGRLGSEMEKWKKLVYKCLELLHGLFQSLGPDMGIDLGRNSDLILHLFNLMSDKSCFLKAATLLEDILGSQNNTFKLSDLADLPNLITNFSDEQIANSCRVLSIAVSELESKESHHTLAAQDRATRNRQACPTSDSNQKILVELPSFVEKLVQIACQKIESSQIPNYQNLVSEIESWVTWLDNSMAFDALAEVVNDEAGVYLNLPLNDIAIPLPQSIRAMHQVVYKVEVLYVLCLLLGGKQRQKVCFIQDRPLMCKSFLKTFTCSFLPGMFTLRKVRGFYFLFLSNKYVLLTKKEIQSLEKISSQANIPVCESVKNVDKNLLCNSPKGILTRLVEVTKSEPEDSPFRFWLARAVESFLRGKTSFADQTFLLRRVYLRHLLETENKSKEVIQSYFDLLAELMKFNIGAYQRFKRSSQMKRRSFKKFMHIVHSNIVDSNMFVRCLVLSLEHFEREQKENFDWLMQNCVLMQHIKKKESRLKFLFKLINVVHVEVLTQENVSCLNTTIIFLMFAERKGNLPIYLHDLRAEEQEQCRPGFLLQN